MVTFSRRNPQTPSQAMSRKNCTRSFCTWQRLLAFSPNWCAPGKHAIKWNKNSSPYTNCATNDLRKKDSEFISAKHFYEIVNRELKKCNVTWQYFSKIILLCCIVRLISNQYFFMFNFRCLFATIFPFWGDSISSSWFSPESKRSGISIMEANVKQRAPSVLQGADV